MTAPQPGPDPDRIPRGGPPAETPPGEGSLSEAGPKQPYDRVKRWGAIPCLLITVLFILVIVVLVILVAVGT
ncbi:hypothetical protein GCM10010218_46630 [Streptomyces mashuensis]|uniref:Uncharacterized protein n=1 Tax=Streptomyces mashuensis TaxID=33904 RepID=A0A919B7E5_9ACTN|nr:DUF6480 family protein [Streptomyces mashuensis]GHF59754.1 hypothetical protein GCM10010218_46630 [Streptomyces mashuensis]